jgi:endonuclease/exonuclease/phosphatase family metal-dependent hydrolase
MVAVSLLVAVAVVLSWVARWIDPHLYGFMSVAGLFRPVVFVANFLCLLYWVVRWRWGVWIPLTVFAAGLWGVTLFFHPEFTREYRDHTADRSLVSVATYNVRGMMSPVEGWEGRLRSNMNEIHEVIDSLDADILCMQEFQSTPDNPRSRLDEALPTYHYKRVRYVIEGAGNDRGWGNAIYSKFPIVASSHIDFEGTSNSILWADIAVQRDTVRVFCVHLQTTAIKASDEQYIVGMDFVNDSDRTSRVKKMVGRLTRGYITRSEQADTLARNIADSPHPVVVCGDFNDTPMSYTYRRVGHRLRDAFREAGHGYGYTYRGFFNLLRIDYVLHSRSMKCVDYRSPSFECSDHNPVVVKLRLLPR